MSATLLGAIHEVYSSKELADIDVSVTIDGSDPAQSAELTVAAHSLVLFVRCSYARDRAKRDKSGRLVLHLALPAGEASVFSLVLRFLYLDDINFDVCSVPLVFCLSARLGVPALCDAARTALLEELEPASAFEVLCSLSRESLSEYDEWSLPLREEVEKYVLSHPSAALQSVGESDVKVKQEDVRWLVKNVQNVEEGSKVEVYEAVVRHVRACGEEMSRASIEPYFDCICFPLIPPQYLADEIMLHNILSPQELLPLFAMHAAQKRAVRESQAQQLGSFRMGREGAKGGGAEGTGGRTVLVVGKAGTDEVASLLSEHVEARKGACHVELTAYDSGALPALSDMDRYDSVLFYASTPDWPSPQERLRFGNDAFAFLQSGKKRTLVLCDNSGSETFYGDLEQALPLRRGKRFKTAHRCSQERMSESASCISGVCFEFHDPVKVYSGDDVSVAEQWECGAPMVARRQLKSSALIVTTLCASERGRMWDDCCGVEDVLLNCIVDAYS